MGVELYHPERWVMAQDGLDDGGGHRVVPPQEHPALGGSRAPRSSAATPARASGGASATGTSPASANGRSVRSADSRGE